MAPYATDVLAKSSVPSATQCIEFYIRPIFGNFDDDKFRGMAIQRKGDHILN